MDSKIEMEQVSNQAEFWISSFVRGDAAAISFIVIW